MNSDCFVLSEYVISFSFYSIFRNSDTSLGMRGHSNGVRGLTSPERGEKRGGTAGNNTSTHLHLHSNKITNNHSSHHHEVGGGSGSSGAHDEKKGGSSSGGDTIMAMWPPKFVIALTNKEKEEDFMAIKGSKLPQRPKKRAKLIQRTLNVSLSFLYLIIPSY